MAIIYLGLGSNIENKRHYIIRATAMLAERVGDILALSSFYETTPWGFDSPNLFLNAAAKMETAMEPEKLLEEMQCIERELGREEKSKDGVYRDRTIDLDLLMYDDLTMRTPLLTIPHPQLSKRRFVLEPLAEIAPFLVVPGVEKSVEELLALID